MNNFSEKYTPTPEEIKKNEIRENINKVLIEKFSALKNVTLDREDISPPKKLIGSEDNIYSVKITCKGKPIEDYGYDGIVAFQVDSNMQVDKKSLVFRTDLMINGYDAKMDGEDVVISGSGDSLYKNSKFERRLKYTELFENAF